jgi:hypothetical protein
VPYTSSWDALPFCLARGAEDYAALWKSVIINASRPARRVSGTRVGYAVLQ